MGLFSLTQELAIDLGTANTLIIYNGKVVVVPGGQIFYFRDPQISS